MKSRRQKLHRVAATAWFAVGCLCSGQAGSIERPSAWELIKQGRWADAERALDAALIVQPDSASVHYLLGFARFRQGKLDPAIAALKKSLSLHESDANVHKTLGLVYAQSNRIRPAERELSRAAELAPFDPEAHYYLGRVQYTRGKLDAALAAFSRTLELAPAHIKAHDNLGLTLTGLGRDQEAEAAFLRAIDLNARQGGRYAWPLINLAEMQVKQSRTADAMSSVRQALVLDPTSSKANLILGKLLWASGNAEAALRALEASAELDPQCSQCHYNLAHVYRRLGRTAQAQQALRAFEATRPAPGNTPIIDEP